MGLLTTGLIWALFVATTLWFPIRRGRLGFGIFVVTMTLNEIPSVLLVVFVASVIAILADGFVDSVLITVASLAVSCLVAAGLVWLQVRAWTAWPAWEAALSDHLGADWWVAERMGDARRVAPAGVWVRGILLPFQRREASVERMRDIPYVPGGSKSHVLDVYRRRDAVIGHDRAAGRPVLIHLHGGGFVQGGKSRESVVLLNRLADHGWVCISANYGLRSEATFPQPLVDTKRVIAWVREHASELGADAAAVFLAGASAGGHLAICAALTAGDARFQPGFEDADTSVRGVVTLYGYLGARGQDPASSPAALAGPDAPPLLIVHGGRDTALPPAGPRSVVAVLRARSRAQVVYVELPNAQHGFDFFGSVRARSVAVGVEAFLEWARARSPRS